MANNKKELMKNNVSCILSRGPGSLIDEAKNNETVFVEKEQPAVHAETEAKPYFEAKGRPRRGQKKDWEGIETFTTSFAFDSKQYDKLEQIAYEMRLSKKVAMRKLLAIGIKHFERTGSL